MAEMLDVFDAHMRPIGVLSREETHRLGHWHQTFHCWVVHRLAAGNFLLLQKRHESKDTHPGKFDTSCAGHLESGETPLDGVREIREELGVEVDVDQLHKVGIHAFSDDLGEILDREFCHVFVWIREGLDLREYRPALDEVSGLYLIGVGDMRRLCGREIDKVAVGGFAIQRGDKRVEELRQIRMGDLARDDPAYFNLLFSSLDALGLGAGEDG